MRADREGEERSRGRRGREIEEEGEDRWRKGGDDFDDDEGEYIYMCVRENYNILPYYLFLIIYLAQKFVYFTISPSPIIMLSKFQKYFYVSF